MEKLPLLVKMLYATELIQLRSNNDFIDELKRQLTCKAFDGHCLADTIAEMQRKHDELMAIFDEIVDCILENQKTENELNLNFN